MPVSNPMGYTVTTLAGERLRWVVAELGGFFEACLHLRWWRFEEPWSGHWKPARVRVDRYTMQLWVQGRRLPVMRPVHKQRWKTPVRQVVTDWLASFEVLHPQLTHIDITWWETPTEGAP